MTQTILRLAAVYQGWLKVLKATVRTDEGEEVTREIIERPDAVAVLPYDPGRRTAVVIRLPRIPVLHAAGQALLMEAPAGLVDEGEDPVDAVRREAEEECGLKLGTVEPLGRLFSTPGMTTERIGLYLAPYSQTDRTGKGGGVEGEHEEIEVLELPLAELAEQADGGRIEDMKTYALVQALRVRRPELFAR